MSAEAVWIFQNRLLSPEELKPGTEVLKDPGAEEAGSSSSSSSLLNVKRG